MGIRPTWIVRFRVYYGVETMQYTNVASTTTNTLSLSISNLVRGVTYYFMCTAVDTCTLYDPRYLESRFFRVPQESATVVPPPPLPGS